MYQFVLWGYGSRGKRFLNFCKKAYVKAIIESNSSMFGDAINDIPIISFEEYKNKYSEYDILITVEFYLEIVNKIKKEGINNYFLLKECPYEFRGYQGGKWFDDLPIKLFSDKVYYIYGLNVYSILLREYILNEKGIEEVNIIPETIEKEKAFKSKYYFVKSKDEVKFGKDICFLKACGVAIPSLDSCMQDVFDFSYKFDSYYSNKLHKFKNENKDEKCFIVATGPSLTIEDLNLLHRSRHICFGVNRIYLSFDETKWRPQYLVVADEKILSTYYKEIISCGVENIFISDQALEISEQGKKDGAIVFHSVLGENYPDLPAFSEEPERCIYSIGTGTVVYVCIQIAIFMGFKEIYLLGTDHSYSDNQKDSCNHFHKDYYKGYLNPVKYVKENVELEYIMAKKYADSHGIKIYNASRGGKLEIFDRVDFDTLVSR